MNVTDIPNRLQADAAAGTQLDFRAVREQINDAAKQLFRPVSTTELEALHNIAHDLLKLSAMKNIRSKA